MWDFKSPLFAKHCPKAVISGGEDPPLGILINILKTTCHNFGLAVQEQVSISHKLTNIAGLPTLELDILSNEDNAQNETEGHDLHQKQLIAKRTLEKKNKVRFFWLEHFVMGPMTPAHNVQLWLDNCPLIITIIDNVVICSENMAFLAKF